MTTVAIMFDLELNAEEFGNQVAAFARTLHENGAEKMDISRAVGHIVFQKTLADFGGFEKARADREAFLDACARLYDSIRDKLMVTNGEVN